MNYRFVAIAVLVLVVIYGATVKVSESNWACGSCHMLEHERWAQSTHKTADCAECHIDPGVKGAFDAQISGLNNLMIAITKGTNIQPHEDPIPVSTDNCIGCHAAILYVTEIGWEDLPENSLKGQGLKIGHRVHVEKYTVNCVECHRGVVHRDPAEIGKYEANWPFMHKDCSPCHTGEYSERFQVEVTSLEDKSKCTVCHPTYIPPPDYEPEIIR